MKKLKSHIHSFEKDGRVILHIDTYELVDFIEDYLIEENDIVYESLEELSSELRKTNRESYHLYISKDHNSEEVENAINKLDDQEIKHIVEFQWAQSNGKFYCPCCGYNTLNEPPGGTYKICDICFWEDDPIQLDDPDYEGGANRVSLNQGQQNFEKYGACEKEMVKMVTKPTKHNVRNPEWKRF